MSACREVPTERRRSVGRLSDAVYRTAFEESPLPICLFDFDGNYLQVNRAYCALVAAEEAEILGSHASRFTHPDESTAAARNLRALRDGRDTSCTVERRLRTADGRTVHVVTEVTVLHHHGEPIGILSMVSDVTRRVETEAQLRHRALHDSLTGLPNREHLGEVLAQLRSLGAPVALCFADLDGFKQLNDGHGHQAGDRALASIGGRMRSELSLGDVALRVAGDEFVVIRAGVDDEHAATGFGEEVRRAIRHDLPVGTDTVTVTGSVGVAFGPVPSPELLELADAAMYRAKRSGRDCVRVLAAPLEG